jgi:hypothetical protein
MEEKVFASNGEQLKDWLQFQDEIFTAPTQTPCVSYPEAYFDDEPGLRNLARAGCESCPVQLQCLRYALKWEPYGMWGGLSAAERKAILKARQSRAS